MEHTQSSTYTYEVSLWHILDVDTDSTQTAFAWPFTSGAGFSVGVDVDIKIQALLFETFTCPTKFKNQQERNPASSAVMRFSKDWALRLAASNVKVLLLMFSGGVLGSIVFSILGGAHGLAVSGAARGRFLKEEAMLA